MGKLDIQKIVSEELSELTEKEKRKILHDLDEAKVTPLKVSKAYDALAKVTAELLKNLKAYKDATTDSDKEKYKKVAATLTAKKKQAQKILNSMIVQLDKDTELHLENIIRGELNESNAKDVFKFAKEALLQTTKGRRLDQRYVRDYLKSIEQISRKKPGQFVKDYEDFGVADWIEDVEYNMRNEGFKSDAQRRAAFASGYKAKGKKGKKKEIKESVEKDLMKAKKGAKAKGGGYGPFVKISGNSWKNPKTGRLMHSQALASHIGGFNDFIIEGKLNEAKEYRAGDTVKLKTGETVKINQVVKGPRPEFNTYRAKVKGKQVDFDSTDISEGKLTEAAAELNKLKDAIKMFQDKIKKQGRITNARDEEHLKNLIALYKKMGGKGIKEGKVTEDYSQRARNFRVALRRRLEAMKKGKKIKYGKLAWTALGNGNFKDSRGRTVPYQDIVQDLKFAVQPDIMQHRGARGDDMIDAYLKFENKLTEGLNPVKAARVIFDKLAFAKLIGKQNRKRAEGIIEFQLRAINFGEGVNESNELLSKLKTKLSDEGGAAGFQDLADTAKDMGVDLTPDMLKGMQGITQHRDGDYILEATSLWKHFDAKMKLQDEIIDLEMRMKNITATIKQLHKDMEQEAEPEGGPKATKYGKQIEKYEKMYKKERAMFEKLMAKLDRMEQY